MEIGKEEKTEVYEPAEDPFRREEPAPERAPERRERELEPEREKVGA